jgi:long-subunit fatty acid transport protein
VNSYFTTAASQATAAANSMQTIIAGGAGSVPLAAVLPAEQLAQLAAGLGISVSAIGALNATQVQGAFQERAAVATGVANQTTNKELSTKQSGFGIAPIIGFDFKWNELNIGVKYEFKTKIELENDTKENTTGVADFNDKAKTPYDLPALLTIGAQYDILPQLTVSAGYHHFFDSDAKMANGKQQYINGGVNEYLAGVEYRINDMFLVSCGTQVTRQGVTDPYQSDMSFALNSYSLGFGGAVQLTKNIKVNLAYLLTNYDDWTKVSQNYGGAQIKGTDIFGRTNQAFGIGLDFRF